MSPNPVESGLSRERGRGSTGKRDRVEMPSVIGFTAVDRAAIAEKGLRLGIGAAAEVLDVADARPTEPCPDVAGEIEQGMAGARRASEETFVRGIVGGELRQELWPDLVARLPDHRAERRHDARAVGAAALHDRDGCFRDARRRTRRTGSNGASNTPLPTGK